MVPILNDELQLVIERIGPMAVKIRLVSQWVKGLLAIFNRSVSWWSVDQWRTYQWVGGSVEHLSVCHWSAVGGSVEDLPVGRWLFVRGRWSVGGRWFCNTLNYRTVSVLPLSGKILKKLLYNSFFSFFIENNLISQNQSIHNPKDSPGFHEILSVTNDNILSIIWWWVGSKRWFS